MKMYFLKLQLEVRSQDLKTNQKRKRRGKKEPNKGEEDKNKIEKQKQKKHSHECLRKMDSQNIPTTNHCITCQFMFLSLSCVTDTVPKSSMLLCSGHVTSMAGLLYRNPATRHIYNKNKNKNSITQNENAYCETMAD